MPPHQHLAIDRIIDIDPFALPADFLFPSVTAENLKAASTTLAAEHLDPASGSILLAIQSHVIRVAGKTILIDTCVGEHKSRPLRAEWNQRSGTRYLANLAAAGCQPEQVDFVMCTHLHADHVGWNTRLESGRWVPTFPRARYLMSAREVDQRTHEARQSAAANHSSFQDSVAPLLDADVVDVKKPGDTITEGTLIVDLAGHSPGQIGLKVTADIQSPALFCGDAIHSPLQVLFPELASRFCSDPRSPSRPGTVCWNARSARTCSWFPAIFAAAPCASAKKAAGFIRTSTFSGHHDRYAVSRPNA